LAGIGGTLQFIGGVADTTNVPPHSIKCSAGAPREWCSIQGAKSPFSFSDSVIRYFGPWKSAKVEAAHESMKGDTIRVERNQMESLDGKLEGQEALVMAAIQGMGFGEDWALASTNTVYLKLHRCYS
jgi:hypothetical protein